MPARPFVTMFRLSIVAIVAWMVTTGPGIAPVQAQLSIDARAEPRLADDGVSSWRYDLLQLLLEEKQMKVERSLDSIIFNAKKSVIVVGNDGNNGIRSIDAYSMIQYVERGGALLLMHELNGFNRASAFSLPGMGTFYKGPVLGITDQDSYEGFADCVRVTNVEDRDGLLYGIKSLITNRSGWFQPSESSEWNWENAATFPTISMPVDVQPKALLCIGRPNNGSGGIAIVIADSSLLTNNMLWHGDNGRLALRLTELFQQQGRDSFHMLRNNVPLDSVSQRLAERLRKEQERMRPPDLPRPKPTFGQMLELGNIVAKEVIDSNVLNEALQRQPRHLSPKRYFRVLMTLLIAALIAWILWKSLSSRTLREFWLARRRQRYSYEIHSGNEAGDYRTAACYLAQEFCIQWTGSHHSRQWQQALATMLVRWPSLSAADRHELTTIVDIASRGCHQRMLGADFQKFGKTIETLRRFLITASTA